MLLEGPGAAGTEYSRAKVGRVQLQVKWASEAMDRNLGFILIVMGNHGREICCLFLRWRRLSVRPYSDERSWPGVMSDRLWARSRHRVQVPTAEVVVHELGCARGHPLLCPCPWAPPPLPDPLRWVRSLSCRMRHRPRAVRAGLWYVWDLC